MPMKLQAPKSHCKAGKTLLQAEDSNILVQKTVSNSFYVPESRHAWYGHLRHMEAAQKLYPPAGAETAFFRPYAPRDAE